MIVSQRGIDLVKKWEGCKLEAYPDPGSRKGTPWTIGWGSTGPNIKKGTKWTQVQADQDLYRDLNERSEWLTLLLIPHKVNQDQFDALVSLLRNIGRQAFETSTLMSKIRHDDLEGAAKEFPRWNKNDGKVVKGLVNRRADEQKLFKGETEDE